MNLLIVNDEALTADTMKDAICWEQYGIDEVFTAYDANNARAVIRSETIDIILCDIEMPGENGLSLMKWVRDNAKDIECVFLTCHASFEYAQEAIGLKCQDYILIPAKYEDIGEAINNVVLRIKKNREDNRLCEYGKIALKNTIEEACGENDTQKIIQTIKRYTLENLGEETLSVASIAEAHYIHPVYMNRIFKKKIGVSVGQYIMDERMHLAKHLLESGKISANTVALRIGYRNYSSFSTAFKKYFGFSPSSIMTDASRGGSTEV